MGMDAISKIDRIDRSDKPQVNKISFADGFDNFMNKLRSGQPVIGNLLNGQAVPPQADQQAFRS